MLMFMWRFSAPKFYAAVEIAIKIQAENPEFRVKGCLERYL